MLHLKLGKTTKYRFGKYFNYIFSDCSVDVLAQSHSDIIFNLVGIMFEIQINLARRGSLASLLIIQAEINTHSL